MKTKFTCGADPEMFLMDIQGQLKSAIGLVGGSKAQPQPLPLGDGYAVQEDNVAVEFNIPPAEGRSSFVHSINSTLNFLTQAVKDMHGLSISHMSAVYFPKEQLDNPAAMEFGCDPDFNAWTLERNPRPNAVDATLRSCGGHVHVGFDKTKADEIKLIQMMDLNLGVPSVLMDKGELRKQLYGKAGAFRSKSYGAEYRTLSNFWIFEDKLIEWVWDGTAKALSAAELQLVINDEDGHDIVSCINNNDKALAEKLIKKFNLEVVHV